MHGRHARENIREAGLLYREALKANLNMGCLEVALQALGADIHFQDLLDKDANPEADLQNLLERHGLAINWRVSAGGKITGEMLDAVFEKIQPGFFDEEYPHGTIAGYLGLENYPWQNRRDHAIAIMPRDLMPRNTRRNLKKKNAYIVIDTKKGGMFPATTGELAGHITAVQDDGGIFQLVEIRKRVATR